MEWSNEKVLELISEYQARPLLWDYKDRDYKNRIKKNKAWEELANNFNISTLEIERKFKILLVQYRRERLKISKLVEQGYDITELENRAWYAYKNLKFLEMKAKVKRNMDGFDMDSTLDSTNSYNETEYEEIKREQIEPHCDDEYETSESNIENFLESTIISAPEVKRPKLMTPTSTTSTPTQYRQESADDIDVFASYVVSEIRNLSNPQLKKKIKTKILRALLEIREEDDLVAVE